MWKAARYTSAAPVYFEPEDGFIDGGVKANNPTDYALTKIQKFYDINDKVLKESGKVSKVEHILVNPVLPLVLWGVDLSGECDKIEHI